MRMASGIKALLSHAPQLDRINIQSMGWCNDGNDIHSLNIEDLFDTMIFPGLAYLELHSLWVADHQQLITFVGHQARTLVEVRFVGIDLANAKYVGFH